MAIEPSPDAWWIGIWSALSALGAALLTVGGALVKGRWERKRDSDQSRIETHRSYREDFEAIVKRLREDVEDARRQMLEMRAELDDVRTENRRLRVESEAKDCRIDELERHVKSLSREVEKYRQAQGRIGDEPHD